MAAPAPSAQISIIVPLYNEEAALPLLFARLDALLLSLPLRIEIVLVDDGSRDATPAIIHQKAMSDPRYQCLSLSRNFGHQLALTAGFNAARGTEALFVIDGDLQDPPELLPQFYELMQQGHDVVYGVRRERKEGWLKIALYHLAYRVIRGLAHLDIPLDSGDFALVSRRVVDIMKAMPEGSRYLRGLRAWVGFSQTGLEYERAERVAGKTKYSFKALLRLAFKGIINFSELPVRFISWLGAASVTSAMIYFAYTLYRKWMQHDVPIGFTALLAVIILFNGVTLLSIGLLGEYVLRIFMEQKNRPLFIVKHHVQDGHPQTAAPHSPS